MSGVDVVTEDKTFPQMSTGAPMPLLLADDESCVLSYYTGDERIYVKFTSASYCSLGGPNDETLHGHPLFDKRLRHYAAYQVDHSSLIDSLEKINSVHSQHNPARFAEKTHYILTFHDTTFECVADYHYFAENKEGIPELEFMKECLEKRWW